MYVSNLTVGLRVRLANCISEQKISRTVFSMSHPRQRALQQDYFVALTTPPPAFVVSFAHPATASPPVCANVLNGLGMTSALGNHAIKSSGSCPPTLFTPALFHGDYSVIPTLLLLHLLRLMMSLERGVNSGCGRCSALRIREDDELMWVRVWWACAVGCGGIGVESWVPGWRRRL